MAVHTIDDFSVFSVGGTSYLTDIDSATFEYDEEQIDASSIVRFGQSPNGVKLGGKVQATVFGNGTNPDRISHLDVTAFTMGGTNYLSILRSLTFAGSFSNKRTAGIGAWWRTHRTSGKHYTFTLEMDLDDDTLSTLLVAFHSSTYANRDSTISFTLNAIVYTVACRVKSISQPMRRDDLQTVSITLEGKDPGSGAYPAAPTTSTTLFTKALNDAKTLLACAFTSKAADGAAVTGYLAWDSFSMRIEDDNVVRIDYSWLFSGTISVSAT